MTKLHVALAERAYDIHIGSGLLAQAGALMLPVLPRPRVFVVTDQNVAALHLPALHASLAAAGISYQTHILPPGEHTKDFRYLEELLDVMLAARCERSTTVVALGGGVIGDLAGFAAAILLRGVPYIQIPTTLLAQVDSSVGGKTAIDTKRGKNLVGAFYQPTLVLADVDVLSTLPARELRAGYAEVVKYGVLGDAGFFDWLEENGAAVLAGDAAAREEAVRVSCAAKAAIVVEDERETGDRRALLNLGHTFGHALEAEAGFGDILLHGEGVAIGMVLALSLSVKLGLCPAADLERLRHHLVRLGLPVTPPRLPGRRWEVLKLLTHMASDKKVTDGRITFILARRIGEAFVERGVAPAEAGAVMDAWLEKAEAGVSG